MTIGLIDGPVVMNRSELANQHVREIPENGSAACTQASSTACLHGTFFVAGILSAKRGSVAPAICPNCTLLVQPVLTHELARAMVSGRASRVCFSRAIVEGVGHVGRRAGKTWRKKSGQRQLPHDLCEV